jgi:3-oxoacyl-[acyl-carrier protein] reductase
VNLELDGKVAVVTAASRGLGFACARALAAEGARVAICSRSLERTSMAAAQITQETGTDVLGLDADITNPDDVARLIRTVAQELGPIDVLVINTGNPPAGRILDTTTSDWETGLSLCLRAPIALVRQVLPSMVERHFGRIIFLTSAFACEADETHVISSTIRAGVHVLAKSLAREYGPSGVRVNAIAPGYFNTPLLLEAAERESANNGAGVSELLAAWAAYSPARRLGNPAELGSLVAYLCSPAADFVHGATIPVDGGFLRR